MYHGDDIFPKDDYGLETELLSERYEDWDAVVEVCDDEDVDYPIIPQAVKDAQIELAFQVAHSHLMTLTTPMDEGEVYAQTLSIGGLSVSAKEQTGEQGIFSKMKLDSMTIVQLKLRTYLAGKIRGMLI
jgi:hypothetical protein